MAAFGAMGPAPFISVFAPGWFLMEAIGSSVVPVGAGEW